MHYCCIFQCFQNRARQVGRVLSIGPGFFLIFAATSAVRLCSLVLSQRQFSFFVSLAFIFVCTFVVVALAYTINVRPPVSTR